MRGLLQISKGEWCDGERCAVLSDLAVALTLLYSAGCLLL